MRRSLSCKYCSRLVASCVGWLSSSNNLLALSRKRVGLPNTFTFPIIKKILPSFTEHVFLEIHTRNVRTKVKCSSLPRLWETRRLPDRQLLHQFEAHPAALVDPIPNQCGNFGDEERVPQSRHPVKQMHRRGHLRWPNTRVHVTGTHTRCTVARRLLYHIPV